jgi:hypothetical protein
MTVELQHAMAQYEEARIQYRKAVLASLNGDSNGDAIRQAIQAFQAARAELAAQGGTPAAAAPKAEPARTASPAWSFVRRLLQAG